MEYMYLDRIMCLKNTLFIIAIMTSICNKSKKYVQDLLSSFYFGYKSKNHNHYSMTDYINKII